MDNVILQQYANSFIQLFQYVDNISFHYQSNDHSKSPATTVNYHRNVPPKHHDSVMFQLMNSSDLNVLTHFFFHPTEQRALPPSIYYRCRVKNNTELYMEKLYLTNVRSHSYQYHDYFTPFILCINRKRSSNSIPVAI